jgi:hypothetical protein
MKPAGATPAVLKLIVLVVAVEPVDSATIETV